MIGFLRGINVGGHRVVRMAALRECLDLPRVQGLQTYVQSGNLVFQTQTGDIASLTGAMEEALRQCFGFEIPVILRTAEELRKAAGLHPFLTDDPGVQGKCYYIFPRGPVPADLASGLRHRHYPEESWEIGPGCIYLYCRRGYGRAKLTNGVFEKTGGMVSTARNYRTVRKMLELGATLS